MNSHSNFYSISLVTFGLGRFLQSQHFSISSCGKILSVNSGSGFEGQGTIHKDHGQITQATSTRVTLAGADGLNDKQCWK